MAIRAGIGIGFCQAALALVQEIEKSTHISEGVVGFLAGLKLLRGRVLDALQAAEFELIAENPEDWMVEN